MEKAIEKEKTKRRKSSAEISDRLIKTVCARLARNERVRRTLPGKGRLHIDRQVPFLCVYRQPPDHEDAGTERLVKGEASYLMAPGAPEFQPSLSKLVQQIVQTLSSRIWRILDRGNLDRTGWRQSQRSGGTTRCCRPSRSTVPGRVKTDQDTSRPWSGV